MQPGFGRKGLAPSAPLPRQARKFRVNSRKAPLVLMLGMSVSGALVIASYILAGAEKLPYVRLLHLGPTGSTLLASLILIGALVMGGMSVRALALQSRTPKWLVLDDVGVSGPRSILSTRLVRIPYREIQRVKVRKFQDSGSIEIIGTRGEKISLGSAIFASDQAFHDFVDALWEYAPTLRRQ